MINLLPESAKAMVRREYLTRMLSVWAFLAALALLASALLLLPLYVLYAKQMHTTETNSDALQEAGDSFAQMSTTLTDANAFAAQLSQSLASVRASAVLTHVEEALPSGVVLTGLYVVTEKNSMRIEAHGKATTRESLRKFIDVLKRDAFFLDAQVPVSDLARDVDLAFTVTLTLRTAS